MLVTITHSDLFFFISFREFIFTDGSVRRRKLCESCVTDDCKRESLSGNLCPFLFFWYGTTMREFFLILYNSKEKKGEEGYMEWPSLMTLDFLVLCRHFFLLKISLKAFKIGFWWWIDPPCNRKSLDCEIIFEYKKIRYVLLEVEVCLIIIDYYSIEKRIWKICFSQVKVSKWVGLFCGTLGGR